MQITALLAADLRLLSAALYDPSAPTTDVAQTILAFGTNVRAAVRSFAGLTVDIVAQAGRVERVLLRFTLLEEHVDSSDIKTSLRLPGPTDGPDPDQLSVQVVLYAVTPGAFVDMAADLAFLTGRELGATDLDQHLGLARAPDITGVVHADTAVHEAVGVLIDRGRTREEAFAELDAIAEAARTDRVTEATGILAALAAPDASGESPS